MSCLEDEIIQLKCYNEGCCNSCKSTQCLLLLLPSRLFSGRWWLRHVLLSVNIVNMQLACVMLYQRLPPWMPLACKPQTLSRPQEITDTHTYAKAYNQPHNRLVSLERSVSKAQHTLGLDVSCVSSNDLLLSQFLGTYLYVPTYIGRGTNLL